MLKSCIGTGISVRRRHAIGDEVGAPADQALRFELWILSIKTVHDQRLLATLVKLSLIDYLESLHTTSRRVSTSADALKVYDLGGRLHHHALAQRPNSEGEVCVLVIPWCK